MTVGSIARASHRGSLRTGRDGVAGTVAASWFLVAGLAILAAAVPVPAATPTRASINGSLAAWDVFRLDPDTPNERPSSTLELRLDAARGEHLHLFASTRIGYDGKIGHPEGGNPVLDLDEVYQRKDFFLSFDEAYADFFLGPVELRVGKQKVAWGQLDDLQPTDHLNPQDQTEFVFRPEAERKIGVPGLRLRGYQGPWTIDGVWNPVYTAYRLPAPGDRR